MRTSSVPLFTIKPSFLCCGWLKTTLVSGALVLSLQCQASSNSIWDDLAVETDYQVNLQSIGSGDSVFVPNNGDSVREQINALLDISAHYKSISGNVALLGTSLYDNGQAPQREVEAVITSLTYETSVTLGGTDWDLLLGKARLDWGVGYGYRVWDIFTPYRRNPVGIQVEEGAGTAALSHYGVESEWTLIATDSSWTQLDTTEYGKANQQQGIGGKYYRLMGDLEAQVIAYYDNVREGLVGGSLVNVFNNAWSGHSSLSYSRSYQGYGFEPGRPAQLRKQSHATQFLVGGTWSHASGISVIGEYWYDSRAWHKDQWQKAHEYAKQNPSPISASYALGYTQQNMVQHNIMLHSRLDPLFWTQWEWSKDSRVLQNMKPRLDLLIAPEDGGVIATQWIDFELIDTGNSNLNLEFAARFVTGASNSVYANLPDTYNILINLKGRF
ncbi:hypothetical protein J4N45_06260 [Vibrio sp. SCSIO 43140]|uniref:hypothetical protein n=1 Tax=Vibrio sp. SCSIO 43140 TaxID=2819100 RepID=UPI002075F192|nr:hypothetical protein [Vibrio sp. SCSIO 43140]USD61562.1 hypothetical protein J4N45_06260 [Vibrio sp. SCSIO 43140]